MQDILDYPVQPHLHCSGPQETSSNTDLPRAFATPQQLSTAGQSYRDDQDTMMLETNHPEGTKQEEEEMLDLDFEPEEVGDEGGRSGRSGDTSEAREELLDFGSYTEADAGSEGHKDSARCSHRLAPVSSTAEGRHHRIDNQDTETPLGRPLPMTSTRTPSPLLDFESDSESVFSPTLRLSGPLRNSSRIVPQSSSPTEGSRRRKSCSSVESSSTSSPLLRTPSPIDDPYPPNRLDLSVSSWNVHGQAVENDAGIRSSSPTQEEMDAFFGFVDPLKALAPQVISSAAKPTRQPSLQLIEDHGPSLSSSPLSSLGSSRASSPSPAALASPRAFSSRRSEGSHPKRVKVSSPSGTIVLKPISDSSSLTSPEKSLAIISALQRLALDILQKLVSGVQVLALSEEEDALLDGDAPGGTSSSRMELTSLSRSRQSSATLCIEMRKRGGRPDDQTLGNETASKKQRILFPRKLGKASEVRFGGRELACFLRVVELVLDGLIEDVIATKRDIYYRDVSLFRKQQTVDTIIEDLAASLMVRRSDLNVVATSKGLFSGGLTLHMKDGSEKKGSTEGTLIPPAILIDHLRAPEIAWVLVIEKDAVFQTLSTTQWDSSLGRGVLITGKGFPDVSTRELVKKLADEFSSVPVMFLVDADPHGIEIISTFVLGSSALSHDSSNLAIGIRRATWLGLRPTSIGARPETRDQMLMLNARDRRKILAMLKREWFPEEWKRELEYMLHLQRKAEIEILSSSTSSYPGSQLGGPDTIDSTYSSSSRLADYITVEIRRVLSKKNEL